MSMGGEPGPWGPAMAAGRAFRLIRRVLASLVVLGLVGTAAIATTGMLLVQKAEESLTRVPVPQLEQAATPTDARHFLLVGSDARDGLEDRDLPLGRFDGQRADTMIYVAISEDREEVSLVSLPRDLLVMDGDRQAKLTDTFAGGPDHLVGIIGDNFGLPVNHFAQISLGGFLDVVDTLGGVEMDIPERLVDPKSGADFEPGVQHLSPEDALAYVRSRQGARGDFERIERQQRFIRAVMGELVETRVLTDPRLLFQLVDDVATSVTTDEHLGVNQMRAVADEMRQVVRDGIPMTTVPAYPQDIGGIAYMIRYGPGADAMFEALRNGEALPRTGTPEEREETRVALYSGGRQQAGNIVGWTLQWSGFDARAVGVGTESIDAGDTTVVYALPGEDERAGWVAAVLGAEVRSLPSDVQPPEGYHVVVAAGEDATS
jgi:LCP family protein required for cell wall assembly